MVFHSPIHALPFANANIFFAVVKAVTRRFRIAAASPEVEQVPDREQAAARAPREERHARLPRRSRQRGILVLYVALLQAEVSKSVRLD